MKEDEKENEKETTQEYSERVALETGGDILAMIESLKKLIEDCEPADEITAYEAIGHLYHAYAALGKIVFRA